MSYRDSWIECTGQGVRVRGYYFPWGTRTIPYREITRAARVPLRAAGGRLRIWGTAHPGYWASLDPRRPGKQAAVVLDTGGRVKAFLTPDDPDAFAAELREHGVTVGTDRGPAIL